MTTKIQNIFRLNAFLGAVVTAVLTMSSFVKAAEPAKSDKKPEASSTLQVFSSVKIPVEGMSCMSCVSSIKKDLKKMDGVTNVEVNLVERYVRVDFLDIKVNAKTIAQKLNDLGYKTGTPVSPAK